MGAQPQFNGLVLLGKSSPETMVFTVKLMGLSGSNFPLNQSIEQYALVN